MYCMKRVPYVYCIYSPGLLIENLYTFCRRCLVKGTSPVLTKTEIADFTDISVQILVGMR